MESKLPKRSEVPKELTWALEDIVKSREEWEQEVREADDLAEKIVSMRGTLCGSAQNLAKVFDLYERCLLKIDRFGTYAHMKEDEDTANPDSQELNLKARSVCMRISEKLAFMEPEILALSEEKLEEYFSEDSALGAYEVTIREMMRKKEHSLDAETERLLSSAAEMAATAHQGFSMLSDADLRFPSVKKADGEEIRISNGRFVPLQLSPDRELRKEVFVKFYSRYEEFKNTWAALYDGQVRSQIFFARARKYPSTFVAAVDGNNVDPSVCDNLIASVRRGLPKMHRYVRLRKKLLGVDELHMYDVYVPMIRDYSVQISYEEAKELSLKALAPLGEEYLSVVRKAYEERWIDVMENEGKRSGAYSARVYGVHPYMLLNYNNTLDNVFTLVHEMGHSLHTWYSSQNQSLLNSRYKIFVAEVASTTNEILLLEYLLSRASSREEKAYLINHYLESFKGTLFRQTMFEEFERKTNAMAEEGIPLTAQKLCDVYYQLNQDYFGPDMVMDPLIACEWCRIPHFYYNFYVYQYATSFSASVAIAHRILKQGGDTVDSYLAFLKSGCTSDPVSLLKIAGVDLSGPEVIDEALEVFDKAVSQMEELTESA